jgi:hypothetical protein
MATWKSEREEEFLEECSEWGVSITRNNITRIGTKTTDVIVSVMQPANYHTNIQSTFSLLREDFHALGLTGPARKKFTCNSINWEWIRVRDDSSDATIQFDALQIV